MSDVEAALAMLRLIAVAECKGLDENSPPGWRADREWILKTFQECMMAVKASQRF